MSKMGPLSNILDMLEYTGVVFGTAGEMSKGVHAALCVAAARCALLSAAEGLQLPMCGFRPLDSPGPHRGAAIGQCKEAYGCCGEGLALSAAGDPTAAASGVKRALPCWAQMSPAPLLRHTELKPSAAWSRCLVACRSSQDAYALSKLCSVMFTFEMAERMSSRPYTVGALALRHRMGRDGHQLVLMRVRCARSIRCALAW